MCTATNGHCAFRRASLPYILALACLAVCAQAKPPSRTTAAPSEAWRIRIANTEYGPVEVSVDRGASWQLIGRVRHAADAARPDGGGAAGGTVARISPYGFAVSTGNGHSVRITAAAPRSKGSDPRDDIVLMGVPSTGALGPLAPAVGDAALVQTGDAEPYAMPAQWTPADGDRLVIVVKRAAPDPRGLADAGAAAWQAAADARARADASELVSGVMTIVARTNPAEPAPPPTVIVTIDGEQFAADVNQQRWSWKWDTRRVTDGEHVIGIDASDDSGALMSRVRKLVYVRNAVPAGQLQPARHVPR